MSASGKSQPNSGKGGKTDKVDGLRLRKSTSIVMARFTTPQQNKTPETTKIRKVRRMQLEHQPHTAQMIQAPIRHEPTKQPAYVLRPFPHRTTRKNCIVPKSENMLQFPRLLSGPYSKETVEEVRIRRADIGRTSRLSIASRKYCTTEVSFNNWPAPVMELNIRGYPQNAVTYQLSFTGVRYRLHTWSALSCAKADRLRFNWQRLSHLEVIAPIATCRVHFVSCEQLHAVRRFARRAAHRSMQAAVQPNPEQQVIKRWFLTRNIVAGVDQTSIEEHWQQQSELHEAYSPTIVQSLQNKAPTSMTITQNDHAVGGRVSSGSRQQPRSTSADPDDELYDRIEEQIGKLKATCHRVSTVNIATDDSSALTSTTKHEQHSGRTPGIIKGRDGEVITSQSYLTVTTGENDTTRSSEFLNWTTTPATDQNQLANTSVSMFVTKEKKTEGTNKQKPIQPKMVHAKRRHGSTKKQP